MPVRPIRPRNSRTCRVPRTFTLASLVIALLAVAPGGAGAQQLTGLIYRGDARIPVGGVVLVAESVRGDSTLGRTITGARGQFALGVRAGEFRLRALRIGYRPADLGTYSLAAGESRRVELRVPENPLTLQAVTLRASARCDVVRDAGETVATLFNEARKALEATQLRSLDASPLALVALSTRVNDLAGAVLVEPQYRLLSGASVRPFQAAPLEEIEKSGYVVQERGNMIFRGPDAPILLSEAFARAHCLQLVEGAGERTEWIGIGFKPVRLERDKVGIAGTLWLDRASYELRLLEFAYAGLPAFYARAGLGGYVGFTRLPSGSFIESRFELRMPRSGMTSSVGRSRGVAVLRGIERTAGEVLSMRVADTVLYQGDSALERRLLAAVGAQGGTVNGITFGAIRGQLIDSLRARDPGGIAGDTVLLPDLSLRAVTDFTGAFDFKGVPPGRYRLYYHAAWFDSLGLSPLMHTLDVNAGEVTEATLALPALATYQYLQCGSTLDTLDAVVHGEVVDGDGAPVSGALVRARWRLWAIEGTQAVQRLIERADTTGAAGGYVLCGVPKDARFDIAAHPSATDSSGVSLRLDPPGDIRRRDFVLGGLTARVRVSGTVIDPSSRPIKGATIVSLLDPDAGAISRSDGAFDVSVRGQRSQQMRVRALGFEPRIIDVDPRASVVELPVIVLQPVAQGLDTMRVTASRDLLDWRPEFERRRLLGLGAFITEEQLQRLPRVTPNAIGQLAPRSRISRDTVFLLRGTEPCLPRWYIDGYDNGTQASNGPGWISMILNSARSIEVYTAAQAPPKYNDFDGCGAIVVWTR